MSPLILLGCLQHQLALLQTFLPMMSTCHFFIGFKFSIIQLLVGADKAVNLLRAGRLVREAASKGAQVVALPVHVSDLNQHVTVRLTGGGNSVSGGIPYFS